MKYIIKKICVTFLYYLFRIFPIKKNKIFVSNYYGKGYGDIPKYITEELLKKSNTYDIVWVIKDEIFASNLPKKIRVVKRNTLKCIYEQVTSKFWIDNCRKQFYERKRKNQFYIQTWHGCIGYKNAELAAADVLPEEYIKGAKNDSKMADLLISNSKYCTNFYKKYFWYDGEILECGCPRNDIIVNNDAKVIKKVKKYYKIKDDVKICLYAPTFRADGSLEPYNIDYSSLISELEKRFSGKWMLLIRLHPNISALAGNIKGYGENIINATDYPDMQELLVASDFMITDYSSCIFDYALSNKPALIYATDIEEYSKDRDFAIKIEDTPFPLARNNKELKKIISKFDIEKYKSNVDKFYNKMGIKETGKSSKKIADLIFEISNEKKDKNKVKSEDKVLFFNTLMLYIMMASTFIFPLLTFPYLTRTLGTENYGIIVLTNAVMQYFQLLIDFGFILSGTAICSKERNNKEKLQQITSSIIYGKLLLSLLGFIVICVLTYTVPLFKGKEMFIICSYVPLALTSFVPDYLFRGIEKMGIITFRTIVSKFVYTFLVFLLVRNSDSYFFIPLSSFVSNVIIVVWSWSYIVKKLDIRLVLVKFKDIMEQLKESSTFFASRIATTVYSASNVFVLGLYGYTDAQLGIYGASNTLISYGKSLFSPIADSLYPYMIKNKNHNLVKKVICIFVPVIIIGSFILYLLSDLFIIIMCGKDYLDAVPYFKRMIPMLILTLPSYLYGFPMLGSINQNDKANLSVIIGAIFHFVGLVILFVFKHLSFYNIIYLTTITETLILIIRVYCFNKYKKIYNN